MRHDNYDFSGYATRFDLECSDGRIIRHGAFADQNGKKIPLVWMHDHKSPDKVIGYGILEHKDDGEYVYGYFNGTEMAGTVKELLKHGDIEGLSIWANKLRQQGPNVVHGVIREVSLVLAGANPGATIDTVLVHSDDSDEEELYYYNTMAPDINNKLEHSAEEDKDSESDEETKESDSKEESKESDSEETDSKEGEKEMAHSTERTVEDVLDEMTEEQQAVVAYLVNKAASGGEAKHSDMEENEMKKNVFESEENKTNTIAHSDFAKNVIGDAKKFGSMKESYLAHMETEGEFLQHDDPEPETPPYGVTPIDYLFPDAKELNTPPEFIKREMDWVAGVMSAVHRSPFSRIKTTFADITENEARAKGYIKGNLKKEEVFTLLKRETTPTTIYKKQKLDRDDVIDITSFDVVAWIKGEMRMMLDEEIARAILIGDGRDPSSEDKISELNIRPVAHDADLYTIKKKVTVVKDPTDEDFDDAVAKKFIKMAIKARKDYKGSGSPVLYTTADMLTNMLLLEDGIGRPLYDTEQKLATALRVSKIVEVPVMEGAEVTISTTEGGVTTSTNYPLLGLIVNLRDYNVGADKGGAISLFDDFDIDYNQMKYLIETRCSGALTKPYSAIDLLLDQQDPQ